MGDEPWKRTTTHTQTSKQDVLMTALLAVTAGKRWLDLNKLLHLQQAQRNNCDSGISKSFFPTFILFLFPSNKHKPKNTKSNSGKKQTHYFLPSLGPPFFYTPSFGNTY